MTIDVGQFTAIFLEEASEHIGTLETALLELERAPDDAELLGRLFRAAHSIKGGAATFGFAAVAGFSHHLESLLDRVRNGALAADAALVDLLLRATDQLAEMLRAAAADDVVVVPAELVAELERAGQHAAPAAPTPAPATPEPPAVADAAPRPRFTIRFIPARDVLESGCDPVTLLRELAEIATIERCEVQLDELPGLDQLVPTHCYAGWTLEVATDRSIDALLEVFDFAAVGAVIEIAPVARAVAATPVPAASAAPRTTDNTSTASSIRVPVEKADKLVNLVGELVIHQSMVADLVRNFSQRELVRLRDAVAAMERNTRELQERVLSIRMIPVGMVLNRFPRMVRELAAKLGKRVDIVLSGEEAEVDRSVVELIADPLTHLVRNAVDHGLERAADRIAAGKPEAGRIELAAYHQAGVIVIEVRDDGRGLDVAKIRAKAIANGLIDPNAELTEAQTFALILRPGFSTAETVSDISGRGVGLDVVKRNIEALNGTLQIASTPGRGTTFRITLPLTLTILDGLSLRVGSAAYVLPLASIVESIRVRPAQYRRVLGRGEVIDVRGETLPLVRLHALFQVAGAVENPAEGLVVIVEHAGHKLGILVDEVTGQPQVVMKSLESHYHKVDGLMGATILADGNVTLVLDVPGLVRQGATA